MIQPIYKFSCIGVYNKHMTKGEKKALLLLDRYMNLKIGDKRLRTTYWRDRRKLLGFLGGKGRPDELENAIVMEVNKRELDLTTMTEHELRAFMKQAKIGVDCSGLVYQLLTAFDSSFENKVVPTPGGKPDNDKRFRTNADTLTNEQNTVTVDKLSDIRFGDLIRMDGGRHVLIVVQVTDDMIRYAHSSDMTKTTGVHIGRIKIENPELGLEQQHWMEKTVRGGTFREKYDPSKGDGVFRLKK